MRRASKSPTTKMSLKSTLIVIGLLVAYSLLQPKLESWLGVDLPSLNPQDDRPAVVDDRRPATDDEPVASTDDLRLPEIRPNATESSTPAATNSSSTKSRDTTKGDDAKPVPNLGELRDVGGNVFQSTAGLTYRPGSQEGHRIKHILRHHEDDTSRPVHGVFDGDRNEVFAVIDEAYLYTFDHGPPQVTTEHDDGRTIYIVDLGRRVGYVGGQKGRRNDHPAANHVQLILDGTNVITAYPVRVGRRR